MRENSFRQFKITSHDDDDDDNDDGATSSQKLPHVLSAITASEQPVEHHIANNPLRQFNIASYDEEDDHCWRSTCGSDDAGSRGANERLLSTDTVNESTDLITRTASSSSASSAKVRFSPSHDISLIPSNEEIKEDAAESVKKASFEQVRDQDSDDDADTWTNRDSETKCSSDARKKNSTGLGKELVAEADHADRCSIASEQDAASHVLRPVKASRHGLDYNLEHSNFRAFTIIADEADIPDRRSSASSAPVKFEHPEGHDDIAGKIRSIVPTFGPLVLSPTPSPSKPEEDADETPIKAVKKARPQSFEEIMESMGGEEAGDVSGVEMNGETPSRKGIEVVKYSSPVPEGTFSPAMVADNGGDGDSDDDILESTGLPSTDIVLPPYPALLEAVDLKVMYIVVESQELCVCKSSSISYRLFESKQGFKGFAAVPVRSKGKKKTFSCLADIEKYLEEDADTGCDDDNYAMMHPFVYLVTKQSDARGWEYRENIRGEKIRVRMWLTAFDNIDAIGELRNALSEFVTQSSGVVGSGTDMSENTVGTDYRLNLEEEWLSGRLVLQEGMLVLRNTSENIVAEIPMSNVNISMSTRQQSANVVVIATVLPFLVNTNQHTKLFVKFVNEGEALRWIVLLRYQHTLNSGEFDFDILHLNYVISPSLRERVFAYGQCRLSYIPSMSASVKDEVAFKEWFTLVTSTHIRCYAISDDGKPAYEGKEALKMPLREASVSIIKSHNRVLLTFKPAGGSGMDDYDCFVLFQSVSRKDATYWAARIEEAIASARANNGRANDGIEQSDGTWSDRRYISLTEYILMSSWDPVESTKAILNRNGSRQELTLNTTASVEPATTTMHNSPVLALMGGTAERKEFANKLHKENELPSPMMRSFRFEKALLGDVDDAARLKPIKGPLEPQGMPRRQPSSEAVDYSESTSYRNMINDDTDRDTEGSRSVRRGFSRRSSNTSQESQQSGEDAQGGGEGKRYLKESGKIRFSKKKSQKK
jgi:hypothetical protein